MDDYVRGLTDPSNPHRPNWIGVTQYTDELGSNRIGVYVRQSLTSSSSEPEDLKPGDHFPNTGPNMTRLGHAMRQALGGSLVDFYIIDNDDPDMKDVPLEGQISDGVNSHIIWSSRLLE